MRTYNIHIFIYITTIRVLAERDDCVSFKHTRDILYFIIIIIISSRRVRSDTFPTYTVVTRSNRIWATEMIIILLSPVDGVRNEFASKSLR